MANSLELLQEFVGTFTMVTSFFYHCCDSIDGPLWLTEVCSSLSVDMYWKQKKERN